MPPFQPIGTEARWRIVYDLLAAANTGEVVTYDELAQALDLDPETGRPAIQAAMRRAAKHHERTDKRAVDAVPNKGYRVVEAPEHLQLARRYQKRSTNALASGHSKAVNVDMAGLEPDVRHAFEVVAQAFSMQMDFNRRFDTRQAHLERTVAKIVDQESRSQREIDELKARLERLEQTG